MKFSRPITQNMPKRERYASYFGSLRESMNRHNWKSAYCTGDNWCRFLRNDVAKAFGLFVPVFSYSARFPRGDVEVASILRIRTDCELFDRLHELKPEIESDFGSALDWSQSLNTPAQSKGRQVFTSRRGSILLSERELQEIAEWHIESILKLDEVFTPRIEGLLDQIVREIMDDAMTSGLEEGR